MNDGAEASRGGGEVGGDTGEPRRNGDRIATGRVWVMGGDSDARRGDNPRLPSSLAGGAVGGLAADGRTDGDSGSGGVGTAPVEQSIDTGAASEGVQARRPGEGAPFAAAADAADRRASSWAKREHRSAGSSRRRL